MSLTQEQIAKLLEPLHPSRVGKDPRGNAHLESWDVRRYLLRIFGWGGWDVEYPHVELVTESFRKHPDKPNADPPVMQYTVVYRVQGRLVIRDPDGNTVAHFEDGAVGDATNLPSLADAHDMALKTAYSQALKRCAMNLGDAFGLSLYNNGKTDAVVVRTVGCGAPPPEPAKDEQEASA